MQKVLNQDEIDAMFRAARGMPVESVPKSDKNIVACNFRKAGYIGSDHVRSISALHEGFARNLTHWLAAYLRTSFECNLVSVEQIAYREALARIPDVAYVSSFCLNPVGAVGILQLDLAIAFPIIDVLLGGEGSAEPQLRDVTEIEEGILEGVVKIICRELQAAWQPLGLEFEFDQRQQPSQLQRIISPAELTLSLSFEIRMPEAHGNLNLIFPSVVSSALFRKLSRDWAYQKPQVSAETACRIRERIMESPFVVELAMAELSVIAEDLLKVRPGDLLPLGRALDSPASLLVAGTPVFSAVPVRKGNARAAQIKTQLRES